MECATGSNQSALGTDMECGRRIFLHFLDHDTIELFNLKRIYTDRQLLSRFRLLTRVALLLSTEYAVMSAAAVFETDFGMRMLREFRVFSEVGILRMSGHGFDAHEVWERKASYYSRRPDLFPLYFNAEGRRTVNQMGQGWLSKPGSSTDSMIRGWKSSIATGEKTWRQLFERYGLRFSDINQHRLYHVSEELGNSVFNAETIVGASKVPGMKKLKKEINSVITREWNISNRELLSATFLVDLGLLDTRPIIPPIAATLSVSRILKMLHLLGIKQMLIQCPPSTLLDIALRPEWELFRADVIARGQRVGPLWNVKEVSGFRDYQVYQQRGNNNNLSLESFWSNISNYLNWLQVVGYDGRSSTSRELDRVSTDVREVVHPRPLESPSHDLTRLIIELDGIREGVEDAKAFEDWCLRALRIIFAMGLANIVLHPNRNSTQRRDIVGRNVGGPGFWHRILRDYSARQVVFEVKNYSSDLGRVEYRQMLSYLSGEHGRIAFIINRSVGERMPSRELAWVREIYHEHDHRVIVKLPVSKICGWLSAARDSTAQKAPDADLDSLLDSYERLYLRLNK